MWPFLHRRHIRSMRGRTLLLLSLIPVTVLSSALIVHSVVANFYYHANVVALEVAARLAVTKGVGYLPADPQTAVRVADACAASNGILPKEIAFTGVSADQQTLKIRLVRRIPLYVAMFALTLPTRDITVSASSRLALDGQRVACPRSRPRLPRSPTPAFQKTRAFA